MFPLCMLSLFYHNRRWALGSARLHISGRALDAAFLSGLSGFAVTDFFGFQAQEDAELQPGIYISRPVRAPTLP